MTFIVNIEARSDQVRGDGDLGERLLTALEGWAKKGQIAAPAVSEDLRAKTVGVTMCVDGELSPIRAANRGDGIFRFALAEATGDWNLGAIEVVELHVTREGEEAVTVAG